MNYTQIWWILLLLGAIRTNTVEAATAISTDLRRFNEAFARVQGVLHEMPSYLGIQELQMPRDRRSDNIDSDVPGDNDALKDAAEAWYQQFIARQDKSLRRSVPNIPVANQVQEPVNLSELGELSEPHETEISKVKRIHRKMKPVVSKVLVPEKYTYNGSSPTSQFDLKLKNMQGIFVEDNKKEKKKPLVDYSDSKPELGDSIKDFGFSDEPLSTVEQSNNLSHEANYKLSKIEQEQAEASRKDTKDSSRGSLFGIAERNSAKRLSKRRSLKRFAMHNKPNSLYERSNSNRFDKRSSNNGFNPLNEIKLKTSHRLMSKGYGPSLPSNSLAETKREMFVEDMLRRKEMQMQLNVNREDEKRQECNGYVPTHWVNSPENNYYNERFRFDLPGFGPYNEQEFPSNTHVTNDESPREARLSFGDVRKKRLSKTLKKASSTGVQDVEKPLRDRKVEETIDVSKLNANGKSTKLIEAANKLVGKSTPELKVENKEDSNDSANDIKARVEGADTNLNDADKGESIDASLTKEKIKAGSDVTSSTFMNEVDPLNQFKILREQTNDVNSKRNIVKLYVPKHRMHRRSHHHRRTKRMPRQQQRRKRYIDVDIDLFRNGRDFDTFERNEDDDNGVRMRRSLPPSQGSKRSHRSKRSLEPQRTNHLIAKRTKRFLDDPYEDHNGNKHVYNSLGDRVLNLNDGSAGTYEVINPEKESTTNGNYDTNDNSFNDNQIDNPQFVVNLMFGNSSGNCNNNDTKTNSFDPMIKLHSDILNCNAFQTIGQFVQPPANTMNPCCSNAQGQELSEGQEVEQQVPEPFQQLEQKAQPQQQKQKQPEQQQQSKKQQKIQQKIQPQKLTLERQKLLQKEQQLRLQLQEQHIKQQKLWQKQMQQQLQKLWKQQLQEQKQLKGQKQEEQQFQQKQQPQQLQPKQLEQKQKPLEQEKPVKTSQESQKERLQQLLKQTQLQQLQDHLKALKKEQQHQKHRQQLLRALQEKHKHLVEEARKHIQEKQTEKQQKLFQNQQQKNQAQQQNKQAPQQRDQNPPQQETLQQKQDDLKDLERQLEKQKQLNKQKQQQEQKNSNPKQQQNKQTQTLLSDDLLNNEEPITANIESPQDKLNSHLLKTILKGVGKVKHVIGKNSINIELKFNRGQRVARDIEDSISNEQEEDDEQENDEGESQMELTYEKRASDKAAKGKGKAKKPKEKGKAKGNKKAKGKGKGKGKEVEKETEKEGEKEKGKEGEGEGAKDKGTEKGTEQTVPKPSEEPAKPKEKKPDEEVEAPCSSKDDALSEDTYKKLMDGKLSTEIVQSVFESIKRDPDMKLLYSELSENRCCLKKAQELGVYDPHKAHTIKESEELMKKFLDTLGSIIEKQVCARTCLALPPPLNHFYEIVLNTHAGQDRSRMKRNVTPRDMANKFNIELRQIDINKIDQKSHIVKKLLRQYDELSSEDQLCSIKLRDQLLMDLIRLRRMEDEVPRRTRTPKMAKLIRDTRNQINVLKDFESELSSRFINLLKISEVFKDSSFEDSFNHHLNDLEQE